MKLASQFYEKNLKRSKEILVWYNRSVGLIFIQRNRITHEWCLPTYGTEAHIDIHKIDPPDVF